MVQYVRMYGVRYIFSDAARAGIFAGFDTLGTAGAVYCTTLVGGVPNTARTGSMSSTSTEGSHTASTGGTISTEPRVQQALPAVQTSEMVGVLIVSRVLNP